jgi:hypothetical protein
MLTKQATDLSINIAAKPSSLTQMSVTSKEQNPESGMLFSIKQLFHALMLHLDTVVQFLWTDRSVLDTAQTHWLQAYESNQFPAVVEIAGQSPSAAWPPGA